MFAKQFKLTKAEDSGLRDVAIFVSSLYVKAWFQAPLSTSAPATDLQFLKDLSKYKSVNEKVSKAAFKKFAGHLWYLGEELSALAFFDRECSILFLWYVGCLSVFQSRLVSLGCSLSAEPNIMDLLQREHPKIMLCFKIFTTHESGTIQNISSQCTVR